MKVFSIGQNVDLANQIQKFTIENCAPNVIQFVEDNDGKLIVTADVLLDPAFNPFKDDIINPILEVAEITDFVPVEYDSKVLQRINPSIYEITLIDGSPYYQQLALDDSGKPMIQLKADQADQALNSQPDQP